ncbi:hypothetical protein BGZ49_001252, partial [Haplosporangium sp. Z 27]
TPSRSRPRTESQETEIDDEPSLTQTQVIEGQELDEDEPPYSQDSIEPNIFFVLNESEDQPTDFTGTPSYNISPPPFSKPIISFIKMAPSVHPYFDPAQATAFNELATKRDSTFEVCYFGLHGFGVIPRMILAAAGANFTSRVPTDWANEDKQHSPFGVMPLLKETSADGKTTIQVAESDAIERYLAKKFGFAGDNAFEENVINTYSSNTSALQLNIYYKTWTFFVKDPVQNAENKAQLLNGLVAIWIKNHEQHLSANGSNGHYFGNKTTLADIKTAYVIGLIQHMKPDLITEETYPALMKVKTTVDAIPSLKAWKETEEYRTFSKENLGFLGYP